MNGLGKAINTLLIPVEELPPGSLGAIRRQVTENLLTLASQQMKMSRDNLVARDIRPQSDLDWGSGAAAAEFTDSEVTTEIWNITTDTAATGYCKMITSASTVMADQRWIAIYGLRDMKSCFATMVTQAMTLFKITVGNSTKAIWDTSKLLCYVKNPIGICPSPIIIPQNTQFQFEGYILNTSTVCWVSLEGVVVEPRGKVISP